MALSHSPKIVTNNLVLYYDMYNTKKSFLGEPTTNLITASEDFSDASWGKANFTVNTNATLAPNNTLTADAIIATTNDPWMVYSATVTTGTTYTWSIYIKGSPGVVGKYGYIWIWYAGTATGPAAGNAYTLTSEWQRVSVTFTPTGSGTLLLRLDPGEQFGALPSAAGDVYYLWGAQYEVKSYATPYISGSRSTSNNLVDLTGLNSLTTTSLTYATDNTFSFNGTNQGISISSTLVPIGSSPYTVSVWCKRNRNNVIEELLSQWTIANSGNSFFFGFDNSNIRFTDSWGSVFVTGGGTTGVWMNLVGVNTGNNAYIYLNGVLMATKGSALGYTGTGSFVIGYQGQYNAEYFQGSISNVSVYNRALSAEEVKQNFNALKLRYGL